MPPSPQKVRLDILLVEKGLVPSREQARRLIMAGEVLVREQVSDKPGKRVDRGVEIRVRTQPRFVSRGGLKLEAALEQFAVDVDDLVVVDVGASTGGFTDCVLQRGAAHVFAVDVGYGQLAWKLRTDERVTVLERTNIRHLRALPNDTPADLAVIDTSFIGLSHVLPATVPLLKPDGALIALVKPQFEAGREGVGKGGVVRSAAVHAEVLRSTIASATILSLTVAGLTVSPAPGPAGNIEFLLYLLRLSGMEIDVEAAIAAALQAAEPLRRTAGKSRRKSSA